MSAPCGAGLDPRVIQEELLVQLDEVLPLLRGLVLGEDRLHRADGLAGPAVDAFVGVDIEHLRAFVDAVHRADLDAGLVLHVDARLGDDIRHRDLLFSPLSLAADEARQPLPERAAGELLEAHHLNLPNPLPGHPIDRAETVSSSSPLPRGSPPHPDSSCPTSGRRRCRRALLCPCYRYPRSHTSPIKVRGRDWGPHGLGPALLALAL